MNQSTKALLRSLTTAMVVVAIVFAFLISGIRLFGFQVYGVLTGSMMPAYPIGSLIYVRETDPNDLELRDVITYSSGKTIVTHRIVEIVRDETNPTQLRFRTKGDANNDPDASLVGPADIIGKVAFGIPHLGTIANYIQNPPGIYVTIFVGLALIGLVIFMDTDDNKKGETNGQQSGKVKLPDMPWLTVLLAKVGVTWPKQKAEEPPVYPGYAPQQQYPQQYPQQMQYPPQQMPQQYPQGYPQQQYQQYPQQQYPPQQMPQQYSQGYPQQQYQQYPQQQYPPQQMPQQYPQGYPQQLPQQMQYPQQYPQQYAAPLERPKNPLE